MLTTTITTDYFHTRVMTLLSTYLNELDSPSSRAVPVPTIPSLSPVDTYLDPDNSKSSILAVLSPWIDLCSPDPAVYSISRQVLEIEIAYAAFCGVSNIILPSPKLHHGKLHGDGITQYAAAVQDALRIGNYISLSVTLSMMDIPKEVDGTKSTLAHLARDIYIGETEDRKAEDGEAEEKDRRKAESSTRHDFFGAWDAWNIIRTVCSYNARLFVGKVGSMISFSSLCFATYHTFASSSLALCIRICRNCASHPPYLSDDVPTRQNIA